MLQGEHSAIHSTFIKLPFVIKIFVLYIFEWPLKTGFTVLLTMQVIYHIMTLTLDLCHKMPCQWHYLTLHNLTYWTYSDWLARLTPEEKADLYKGIGYDQNANIAKLPKEVSIYEGGQYVIKTHSKALAFVTQLLIGNRQKFATV